MNIAQIDIGTQSPTSAKNEHSGITSAADSSPSGEIFGLVMSQIQTSRAQHELALQATDPAGPAYATSSLGQEMAGAAADTPKLFNILPAVSGNWSLKAVTLGPTLNLITPEKAAPDDQSLEAFARSQGLDESAVQWLMGSPSSATVRSDISGSPISQVPDASKVIPPGLLTSITDTLDRSAVLDPSNMNPSSPIPISGLVTPSSTNANQAAMNNDGPGLANPLASADWTTTPSSQGISSNSDAEITASAGLAAGSMLWSALQSQASSPSSSSGKAPPPDSAETAQIQIQLLREPTPAAIWMLRNTLAQEALAARRDEQTPVALSEIDLSSDISPEFLESLMSDLGESTASSSPSSHPSHPSHASNAGPRHDAGSGLQQAAPDGQSDAESSAARRSENIQNLAEKMGQAVGQRMLTEIEKGQWHLKLQLRPATLGHIEVDMRMLSGEMEAVFTAPQALTRELLQDGMSRLRDTLNQMGMNVASMQVGDGQSRQRGGDSTPNKSTKSSDLIEKESKSTIQTNTWIPRQKMGEDGWDVLV